MLSGIAVCGVMTSASAQAQAVSVAIQPFVSVIAMNTLCLSEPAPPLVPQLVRPTTVSAAKSAAILGNEPSALDLIKMQQAGPNAAQVASKTATFSIEPLSPASNGAGRFANTCPSGRPPISSDDATGQLVEISNPLESGMPVGRYARPFRPLSEDDFLATRRVRIGSTNFDSEWARVSQESTSGMLRRTVGIEASASLATIQNVNRWVNRTITYVEDRELFGSADYWAGARRTLSLSKGDCEDIALTKMQLLAAAGIRREDMYLSIVKDTIRGQDHAFLVVRHQGRFIILDNATDQLLDGSQAHDYNPILSFNSQSAWLHGY